VEVKDLRSREREIWKGLTEQKISGIDLQVAEQLRLLSSFQQYYQVDLFPPTKAEGARYYYENGYYNFTDAFVLQSFIRHFKSRRIIEAGSGFSSAVMLDTREKYRHDLHLTFIEPNPERLYSLLKDKDREHAQIITKNLQDVELSHFSVLEPGDILFIDSTHVSKTGSDVNYIFFEIIPSLKPGVLIHFHDIFYPFEYPREWVYEGRNWNENYLLRSFLMYNSAYSIRFFAHYLSLHHGALLESMPLCKRYPSGNLWIEKRLTTPSRA
jgi:predicted O-methyltransferase YrrM